MYVNARMPRDDFKKGTLTTTTQKVHMDHAPLRCTITLNSAAAGRAIKLGTNGRDGEYYQPTYDVNTPTMLVLVVDAPISHVEFTGAVNDTWRIR